MKQMFSRNLSILAVMLALMTGTAGAASLNSNDVAEASRSAMEAPLTKPSNQQLHCIDLAYDIYRRCMDYWFDQGGDNRPYHSQCLNKARDVYEDCMTDRQDYWG